MIILMITACYLLALLSQGIHYLWVFRFPPTNLTTLHTPVMVLHSAAAILKGVLNNMGTVYASQLRHAPTGSSLLEVFPVLR
jgi:hypothetical protein